MPMLYQRTLFACIYCVFIYRRTLFTLCVHLCTMCTCLPAVIVIDGFCHSFFSTSHSFAPSTPSLAHTHTLIRTRKPNYIYNGRLQKKKKTHTILRAERKNRSDRTFFPELASNDAKACKFAWKCLNLCPCLLIMPQQTIIKILIVHIVYT